MKLNYYPETDSLYIDLSERPSVGSREISEDIFLIMMPMVGLLVLTLIMPTAK